MGRLRTEEILAFAGRDAALADHLSANLYPAPGPAFTEAALDAIAAVDAGEAEHSIMLPNGRKTSAGAVVEGLHLEPFLAPQDEDW